MSLPLHKSGLFAALGAYVIWGVLPIYWKMLQEAGAYEILAHRVLWSFVFMVVLLSMMGKMRATIDVLCALWHDKKRFLAVAGGGFLVTSNWGTYIWAVNSGYIVETSLGYYINPLVSVALGIFVFKETLSLTKKIAFTIAACGILNMTYQFGEMPYIALYLACSFAVYGALKKYARLDPYVGIALETMFVAPFALGYVIHLADIGQSHFTTSDPLLLVLLIGTGIVTATPLILFARGINTLPLNVIGFLQYSSPTLALIIGVFLYGEPFTQTHAVSFSFIWLALFIFSTSEWRTYRQSKKA